jgi:hypothetical protein
MQRERTHIESVFHPVVSGRSAKGCTRNESQRQRRLQVLLAYTLLEKIEYARSVLTLVIPNLSWAERACTSSTYAS